MRKFSAFTLAEVLITLAVIGIVAALTIPALVKNHNERAWSTAQGVFAKKLEVAMKVMNTEGTLTGYSTTEDFVNALKKNIKITKVCTDDLAKCFAKEIVWTAGDEPVEISSNTISYNKGAGQDWAETVGVQFVNGVSALVAYNKNCTSDPYNNQFAASASCLAIIYDVSANKTPNENGKDITSNANVLSVAGKSGCLLYFKDMNGNKTCYSKILLPGVDFTGLTKAECEEIADAGYGNNKANCGLFDSDYWAGAIKACGGTDKVPSMEQLSLLATYLYDYPTAIEPFQETTGSDGYTMNTGKAEKLLSYLGTSWFESWAGEETSDGYAHARTFYNTHSPIGSHFPASSGQSRSNSRTHVLCLGE